MILCLVVFPGIFVYYALCVVWFSGSFLCVFPSQCFSVPSLTCPFPFSLLTPPVPHPLVSGSVHSRCSPPCLCQFIPSSSVFLHVTLSSLHVVLVSVFPALLWFVLYSAVAFFCTSLFLVFASACSSCLLVSVFFVPLVWSLICTLLLFALYFSFVATVSLVLSGSFLLLLGLLFFFFVLLKLSFASPMFFLMYVSAFCLQCQEWPDATQV